MYRTNERRTNEQDPDNNNEEEIYEISEWAFLDAIPVTCLVVDSTGGIVTINAFGSGQLDYTAADLVGQPLAAVIHRDDATEATEGLAGGIDLRLRLVGQTGATRRVRMSARPMTAARDRLLVVFADADPEEQPSPYQSKLESLAISNVLAEERERRRIASGLHDQVGQCLALAKMKSNALGASIDSREGKRIIVDILRYLDETIRVTRSLIFDLSSPVLYQFGLEAALESQFDRLEKQTNLEAELDCDPEPVPLPEKTAVIVFRIVKELVFNVVKHADAHRLRVRVHRDGDDLCLSVEDDGVGMPQTDLEELPVSECRFGLFGIRAGITQIGGKFDIGRSELGGVRADLVVPIAAGEGALQ